MIRNTQTWDLQTPVSVLETSRPTSVAGWSTQVQTSQLEPFNRIEYVKYKKYKKDIRIYVAYSGGQTAGRIGLKFFVDTQGLPGGVLGYKNSNIFSKTF